MKYEGCPGSRIVTFVENDEKEESTGKIASYLGQWPIQMHLISPTAPYYQGILVTFFLTLLLVEME